MTKPVRVLIVDDSSLFRKILEQTLSRDPEIEVIGTAPDAATARQMIKQLNPDVLTLDIEMPDMDGLSFLEKIIRLRPMPVVMVSTLTQEGADAAIKALEMGAVDYHPKPTAGVLERLEAEGDTLCAKVKAAAHARVGRGVAPQPVTPAAPVAAPGPRKAAVTMLVAIGSSTGGVEALHQILPFLPPDCPPVLVTQHMPASFTGPFARRLAQVSQAADTEATQGTVLENGHIYIAPGGDAHLEVEKSGLQFACRLNPAPPVSGHRPSVDALFHSVARVAGARTLGVILTGMGRDGADGLKAIRHAGGHTIGQNEQSCVVYGMPRAAQEAGGVEFQIGIDRIAAKIIELTANA